MKSTRIVATAAVLVVIACAPANEAAAGDVVSLSLEDIVVDPVTTTLSTGTADVEIQIVTQDGGEALSVVSRSGGSALRLPAYSDSTAPPRAVLRVSNATGSDRLSPGTANFAFGATARLDAASQGTSFDNGNNLVQRGLFDDVAQYKLDLDGRYPGCTVKGDLGTVSVRIREAVSPDDWYSLMCTRTDSTLTLSVEHHHSDDATTRQVTSATGRIGAVTMISPAIPMSVGGKLNAAGTITSSTDQFNGLVDDVFLRITA